MNTPKPPHHLVLTKEQSAAFLESGIGFAIAAVCQDGRSTLLLFECDQPAAVAAAAVAQGTHRAVRKTPARQPANMHQEPAGTRAGTLHAHRPAGQGTGNQAPQEHAPEGTTP